MSEESRFVKVSDAGAALAPDAAKWSAVWDRSTGLMYPAEIDEREGTWKKAQKIASECRAAGFDDWRLANRREALSIVDDTRCRPAVDTDFFRFPTSGWAWTSTPWADDPQSGAWGVDLGNGYAYGWSQGGQGLALPVRGPVPLPGQ